MIFDRPTNIELISAVIDFLDTEIKEELPPHLAFKLRIVTNVLKIVQREIDLGDTLSKEAQGLIKEVLESTQEPSLRELASSIKDGNIDLDKESLRKALIGITKSKISVDNPNYSTFKKLVE
jgi:hypothetical protein